MVSQPEYHVEAVEWWDHAFYGGPYDPQLAIRQVWRSVGWVVDETELVLWLGQSRHAEDFAEVLVLDKRTIIGREVL